MAMKPGAIIVPAPEPWTIAFGSMGKKLDMEFYNKVRYGDSSAGRVRISDARRKLVAFTYLRHDEKASGAGLWGARRRARRIILSVNACHGVSNRTLLDQDWILKFATELMRMACNFGDLHLQTMPDRIARNMADIYEEWFKLPTPTTPNEDDDDVRTETDNPPQGC